MKRMRFLINQSLNIWIRSARMINTGLISMQWISSDSSAISIESTQMWLKNEWISVEVLKNNMIQQISGKVWSNGTCITIRLTHLSLKTILRIMPSMLSWSFVSTKTCRCMMFDAEWESTWFFGHFIIICVLN